MELSVDTLEKLLADYQENTDNVDKFIELVHRYTDFTELTTPMIHEFVDKIVVHEADKSTGDRIQRLIFISSMWVNWMSRCRSLPPNR